MEEGPPSLLVAVPLADVVTLNVGGVVFSTTRATLLAAPALGALVPHNATVFVDRDPALFGIVLGFLRAKRLPADMSADQCQALLAESRAYGCVELEGALQRARPAAFHSHLELTQFVGAMRAMGLKTFSGLSLRGANLRGFPASSCIFDDCVLDEAQFEGSISYASFKRASLVGAVFRSVTSASAVDFTGADLSGAELHHLAIRVDHFILDGAVLQGTRFFKPRLSPEGRPAEDMRCELQDRGALWLTE